MWDVVDDMDRQSLMEKRKIGLVDSKGDHIKVAITARVYSRKKHKGVKKLKGLFSIFNVKEAQQMLGWKKLCQVSIVSCNILSKHYLRGGIRSLSRKLPKFSFIQESKNEERDEMLICRAWVHFFKIGFYPFVDARSGV